MRTSSLHEAPASHAAVACAGLVVDGGVYRHDFVAQAVISGLMQAQLETEEVVLSAVPTPHHFHASSEHINFFHEHFLMKGKELAHACVGTTGKAAALKGELGAAVSKQAGYAGASAELHAGLHRPGTYVVQGSSAKLTSIPVARSQSTYS